MLHIPPMARKCLEVTGLLYIFNESNEWLKIQYVGNLTKSPGTTVFNSALLESMGHTVGIKFCTVICSLHIILPFITFPIDILVSYATQMLLTLRVK